MTATFISGYEPATRALDPVAAAFNHYQLLKDRGDKEGAKTARENWQLLRASQAPGSWIVRNLPTPTVTPLTAAHSADKAACDRAAMEADARAKGLPLEAYETSKQSRPQSARSLNAGIYRRSADNPTLASHRPPAPHNKKTLTPEQTAQILSLYAIPSNTIRKVSKETGITETIIRRVLATHTQAQATGAYGKIVFSAEQICEMKRVYAQPLGSMVKVAKAMGVSPDTIRRLFKEHGIAQVPRRVTAKKLSNRVDPAIDSRTDAVCQNYQQGATLHELLAEFKTSKPVVKKMLAYKGVPLRPRALPIRRGKAPNPVIDDAVQKLWVDGYSRPYIRKALSLSEARVADITSRLPPRTEAQAIPMITREIVRLRRTRMTFTQIAKALHVTKDMAQSNYFRLDKAGKVGLVE